MKFKQTYIIGAIVLLLVSIGGSYWAFSSSMSGMEEPVITPVADTVNPGKGFKIDPSLPKTEACPLNGQLYTNPERAIWEKRLPLAVMIENHLDSHPQSGLSKADIVYEAVAEGGITRFMGVFYCGLAENTNFAPVRSARTYYVDWVSEYDALYNHVGGAGICSDPTVDERAKALCQIDQYGIKDMDQFGISFPDCYRNPDRLDHPVAAEHQMVCLSDNLYQIAEKRKWTNVDAKGVSWDKNFTPWKFASSEAKAGDRGNANKIDIFFWKGYADYDVSWEYDATNNVYKRNNGGKPHMDFETNQQLTAKNIVVQLSKETGPVDVHKHILYQTIGTGDAIIFQNGKAIEGTWNKAKRIARTKFFDKSGKEIVFNPGVIWIEIIPKGNKVTY